MVPGGYCGEKFQCDPSPDAPATLNNIVDVESGTVKNCYVCQGDLIVEKAFFSEKSVWLLPFDVSALRNNKLYDHLPETIFVYGKTYQLVGYTIYQGNHFTSIITL